MIKFEETYDVNDYEILTDTGWDEIKKIGKTIPYNVWLLETETYKLECADTHIVMSNENELYVKNLKIGDYIDTDRGPEKVLKVYKKNILPKNMYDLQLEEGNNRYYTNGILSHNTIWMCHHAAAFLRNGYNVMYVTAEMSENAITQRIDANVLDMETTAFKDMPKDDYLAKIKEIVRPETYGRLFVKEYPTGFANKNHFTNYINELKLKRDFKPDVFIGDYVNIFASSRLPSSTMSDSYKYMKAVIEELRALGVEQNMAIITPSQLNRVSANQSVDAVDMTGQSDSWAIPQTADWMGIIIQTPEMYESGNYLLKCVKTRFSENVNEIYQVGCERPKMRLTDLGEEDHEVPLSVRDSHAYQDRRRELEMEPNRDDDAVWVFNEELE